MASNEKPEANQFEIQGDNIMSNIFNFPKGQRGASPLSVSDLIESLKNDDHTVRRKAIEDLNACHYQDPEDSRSYEILESSNRASTDWDPDALKADLDRFSDYSVAYLRAAYPTGHIEDYQNAKVSILYDGLRKAKTKGDILARLSTYYIYSGTSNSLRALDYATAAVLLGNPSEGPGSMVDVMTFLAEAFEKVKQSKAAKLARDLKAHYNPGYTEQEWIHTNFVPMLAFRDEKEIKWAAKIVERRLRDIREKK
jgi:uncharacterized protein YdaT